MATERKYWCPKCGFTQPGVESVGHCGLCDGPLSSAPLVIRVADLVPEEDRLLAVKANDVKQAIDSAVSEAVKTEREGILSMVEGRCPGPGNFVCGECQWCKFALVIRRRLRDTEGGE